MVRVINGQGQTLMSQRHVELELPCAVRVVIDESADQTEAAATLLKIARLIEGEDAEEGGLRWRATSPTTTWNATPWAH